MTAPSALASIANPGTQTNIFASSTLEKSTSVGGTKLGLTTSINSKNSHQSRLSGTATADLTQPAQTTHLKKGFSPEKGAMVGLYAGAAAGAVGGFFLGGPIGSILLAPVAAAGGALLGAAAGYVSMRLHNPDTGSVDLRHLGKCISNDVTNLAQRIKKQPTLLLAPFNPFFLSQTMMHPPKREAVPAMDDATQAKPNTPATIDVKPK